MVVREPLILFGFDAAKGLRQGGKTPIKHTNRINTQILAEEVRLVSADGEQLGIVPLEEALEIAQKDELDVVEVAPNFSPPVCRIMDFGRLIYEQKRRAKEARKKAKHHELKEIKFRPNTDTHDYETKLNHCRAFLAKGHKVKLTVMYRGREMAHFARGTAILRRMEVDLDGDGDVEVQPSSRGRTQSMMVAPLKGDKGAAEKKKEEAPETE